MGCVKTPTAPRFVTRSSLPVVQSSKFKLQSSRSGISCLGCLFAALLFIDGICAVAADLGVFDDQPDVGKPSHPGSATFDSPTRSFLIAGGGDNMWFTNDSFHFVWKRVTGDFALRCAIEWLGSGGNAHRKACLIVRQNLEANSPYIDV